MSVCDSARPDLISGNTNAVCVMIGEKAAAMVARDQGLVLASEVFEDDEEEEEEEEDDDDDREDERAAEGC